MAEDDKVPELNIGHILKNLCEQLKNGKKKDYKMKKQSSYSGSDCCNTPTKVISLMCKPQNITRIVGKYHLNELLVFKVPGNVGEKRVIISMT